MSSFFSFFLPSNPLFIFTFVKLTRREFTDQRSHLTSILPESTSNRPSSVVSKLPPRTSSSRSPQRPAPAAARRHFPAARGRSVWRWDTRPGTPPRPSS
ncbi:putative carboxylesterase 18 [Iris pallida]|uniref:Carboxylesterase 18 n=1 Tax=Iris pallida TaxID=29817 RepID=A0AAX6GRY0_IRIPA|nr:putative carboxylesterase 18 [Iris pallida]